MHRRCGEKYDTSLVANLLMWNFFLNQSTNIKVMNEYQVACFHGPRCISTQTVHHIWWNSVVRVHRFNYRLQQYNILLRLYYYTFHKNQEWITAVRYCMKTETTKHKTLKTLFSCRKTINTRNVLGPFNRTFSQHGAKTCNSYRRHYTNYNTAWDKYVLRLFPPSLTTYSS